MTGKQQKKQTKKPAEEKKEVSFSPSKKIAFYSAALILPFLMLLLVEITLRIAGYGNEYPLVEQTRYFV